MAHFSCMAELVRLLQRSNLPLVLIVCFLCSFSAYAPAAELPGRLTEEDTLFVTAVLNELTEETSPQQRVARISSYFLGRHYRANSLIGGPDTPEQLYADLSVFDCFTFLDTVEALRRSKKTQDFLLHLINVRYRDGRIDYQSRKHFFSDWVNPVSTWLVDVTATIGNGAAHNIEKRLNQRATGVLWLEGLPVTVRTITYLPASKIDRKVLVQLEDGDYLGMYTGKQGLDVSHTGILVRKETGLFIRHASSAYGSMAVVDDHLMTYLADHDGLVVYRAKANK